MIDVHCHVLPGVDDGARTLEDSIALCRAAVADGVRTLVATPHVSSRWPTSSETIRAGTAELNERLRAAGIGLEVLPGAEIDHRILPLLPADELARLTLGDSRHVLVEAPLSGPSGDLESHVHALRDRGYAVLLAHPERSPLFLRDPARLRPLVAAGVRSSVTAASMEGRFGGAVERLTWRLLEEGLVHDVASDFHGARRPPGLTPAFTAARARHPAVAAAREWLTEAAPAAMLADAPLPPAPDMAPARRSLWRRLTG